MEKITVVTPTKQYPILLEQSFDGLANAIKEQNLSGRKMCIIADENTDKLYREVVKKELQKVADTVFYHCFPAGEQHKNLETISNFYQFYQKNRFDRKTVIVALGGGVCGDMAGFSAATYLRGIDFVQIPTTLLAQADSSIGGKTGVDFDGYKNMVGAFYMPKLVYMNLAVLKDLDGRQYYAGMAEVLKSALLRDGVLYEWLLSNLYEICDREPETIEEMILRTCTIKKNIVEKDPYEKGDRALLNLGHTLGHAIEKYKNFQLLHGECVALGTVCAAYISWKRQLLSDDEYYEIRDMFVPFSLPISIDGISPKEVLELTKSDKKMDAGQIKFILLKKVGKAVIDTSVTDDDILNAIKEIYYSEEDMAR